MSNATSMSRQEVEDRLTSRALTDADFRKQLLEDPKAAVHEELGMDLPSEMNVKVVEETPDTVYLVIPANVQAGPSGELSDAELNSVAGAGGYTDGCTQLTCPGVWTCGIS